MKQWKARIQGLWKDEEGAAAVEYGILVAGIILVSILLIYSIGGKVGDSFQAVDNNMQAPGSPITPAG
jgi:pilus assembly protein Flp/PilA